MRDVYDFAKYFLKSNMDSKPNTYDGNMKLQKLLTFANMVSIAEYNTPLFEDEILAFKNGCVIEKVRLRYKNDYFGFKEDSVIFNPDFSENEYTILNVVMNVFGKVEARELSDINHEFISWKNAYDRGMRSDGYHDKSLSVVDLTGQQEDFDKIRKIINAYDISKKEVMAKEIINGITFYYDNMKLTDEMLDELVDFSLVAQDDAYSVYLDNGKMVVY